MHITEGWKDGTPFSEIQRLRQRLVDGTKVLDQFSVDSAAYLNEVRPNPISLSNHFLIIFIPPP
jgi:Berberine and berberine like